MRTRHVRLQRASKKLTLRPLIHRTAVLVILLPVLLAGTPRVLANDGGQRSAAPFRDGIVLLAFRDGTLPAQENAILSSVGAREIKRIGVGVHVVAVKPGQVFAAIHSLKALQVVRYAEPDYLQMLSAGSPPDDTFVGMQWAVQNTGQNANGTSGTSGADERSLAAWGITTGTNSVVIAELDTGVQYTHPDLITNMWNNPGGIGGCPAGTHGYNVLASSCDPMDDDADYGGHGTHVAGIMGAIGNNAAGTAGVNWTTSILAVKWVNSSGTGATSDLITGMDWVVSAKQAGINIRVANDSQTWPGTAFSQALSDEIDLLGSNDILFVTASGNTAQNNDVVPRYPCSYKRPTMICVAASDQNDNLWSSANYGPNSDQLAAPGVNIYSTLRVSNYGYISGGSMASPQVAGTAALILSLGYQSVANLRTMILSNVDVLSSLSGLVGTSGRLNVCKAVPGCSTAVAGKPANSIPPVVTSLPAQGGLLGASTGAWTGIPLTYTYQWSRCDQNGLNCSPVPGATGQTYALLAPADVSATVVVTVTASNSFGSTAAQSSVSGKVVSGTSPSAIGSSIASGATVNGSVNWTLTPSRSEQFMQFYLDGVLSETDSSSPYVFTTGGFALLDTTTLLNGPHVLGARALFTDNRTFDFYGETVTVSNPPQNTALPAISGTVVSGQTLSTTNGGWGANAVPVSFSYQWEHCDSSGLNCTAIAGALASSYVLSGADGNFTVRASVTASNSGGSVTAVSNQTTVVPASPIVITNSALPGGTQNTAYSATLAVSGGVAPYTWSISSHTLPAGLALGASSGVISGTPTGTGTSNFMVQVTDVNSLTAEKALSLTVVAPLTVTTVSLPTGTQNAAYSATLAATGGTPSYTWSIASGSLPAGLTLVPSSGVISGTPTAKATSNFTVRVTDTNSATTTQALSLMVVAPLTITTATLPGGTLSTAYSATVAAAGGTLPFTWSIASGSLPAGLTLAPSTGVISGTPSATGTSNFTVRVTDTNSATTTQTLNMVVVAPLSITTTSLPGGSQNTSYSASVTATGGTLPIAWSIASGSLPAGLTLASATGAISGTPTVTGTSNFTLRVADANSLTATQSLNLTISGSGGGSGIALVQSNAVQGSGVASLSITFPVNNASGDLIIAFVRISSTSQTVSLSDSAGNNYAQAVTQSQSADGSQVYLFYAKNILGAANTVTATFSAANNHPWLAIYEYKGLSATNPLDQTAHAQGSSAAPSSGATPTTSSANELVFAGIGLPASYRGTQTAGSGYTIVQNDTSTSPAASETLVANSTGSFAATFSLNGTANWSAVVATFAAGGVSVTTTSLPGGIQNSAYTSTLAATGGTTPYTWAVFVGALPAGLSLAPSTGVISGIPSATGTSSFTVQVTDANSLTATKPLSIAVISPPTVTIASLPNGTQNSAYTATLAATGGTTPYTWSVSVGALPTGLSLAPSTGVISGTPAATGTSSFTVQVTDTNSLTASQPLSVTVIAGPPTVTTASLSNGTQNAAYSTTLAASGGTTPYTWSVSIGALPAGLSLAPGTGAISGTPTATGTTNFTVRVTDANLLTATKPLSITVVAPPIVATASLPNGTQNAAYTTTLAGTGGTTPYTWSVSVGALPAGLSLAPSTGVISGTPTATGTTSFTAQVKDANSLTASQPLSVTVIAGPPTVTTASLSNGTQNTAYTATLAATGGTTPYAWSVSVGALPAGLSLAPSTGVISGTPTATGTTSFTVRVTDANLLTATKPLSITVVAPPIVATASLPNGTQNAAYTTTLAGTGGTTPYTWSVSIGALPAGLSLAPNTGVISGTPTATGTTSFTVQVTDANLLAGTKPLSITISASSGGGIGLVQQNAAQGSGVSSVSMAFPAANTAGNLIVAFVRMSTSTQSVTLKDSAGNAFVEAAAQSQNSDGSQIHLFYAPNILGAADTVTATFSSANNHPWLAIYEYKGLSTTAPLDQTATAQGTSTTPSSGATPTTTSANELIFAAAGLPASYTGTQTAGSGFTFLEKDTGSSPASNESMAATATGSFTATFTASATVNWSAIIATFKP